MAGLEASSFAFSVYVCSLCISVAHCCSLGSPGVNCLLHIVQAAQARLLVEDESWVLTTHLRHLPPMLRRGVTINSFGCGASELSCASTSSVLPIR